MLIVWSSCQDKDQPKMTEDMLIFGEAYGYCAGDCAHFFKLENNQLTADNIERFDGSEPTFSNQAFTSAQYEIATELLESIPEYLLLNANQTIGCPDCADQGGVYLFLTRDAQKYFWNIDTSVSNQPEEIRDYIAQVRSVIDQLQN